MTAICAHRRIIQYAPAASKEEDEKEINPVGTLAGNATFAKPLKNAGDRKMRRKNWMTSGDVGCSMEEEEQNTNGQEAEAEVAEAAGGEERNGEAVVKELSEAGLAPPQNGSVNGDEGYAEDEVDNVESEVGGEQNGVEDAGTAVFQLLENLSFVNFSRWNPSDDLICGLPKL